MEVVRDEFFIHHEMIHQSPPWRTYSTRVVL